MNLNSFKKIDLKKKITSGTAFFLIICASGAYFGIWKTSINIKKHRSEIIVEKIEIEKKITQEQNKSETISQIKKIEPELDKLGKIFITAENQLEFITALEETADRNKIAQNINLLPNNDAQSSPRKTLINISAQGSYVDLLRYLSDLESLDYYVNINTLNANKLSADKTASTTIALNLGAETYWK